jgi:hypothetical protein
MKRLYLVLLGNFTFHHFEEEELALFKEDTEQKALVHELEEVKAFDSIEKAFDEVDNTHHLSWIIPSEFGGEIVFEREEDEYKLKHFWITKLFVLYLS